MRFTKIVRQVAIGLLLPLFFTSNSFAELQGYVGGQLRSFPNQPLDARQLDNQFSAVIAPEWYTALEGSDSFNISLFYRYDAEDDERTHFDIRELYWQHVGDGWELTAGIKQIFWGVTESQHLVDIVNQTDAVEAFDGEEKLGQPLLHLALLKDWGTLDIMLLPGFRERSFAGVKGRLRSQPLTVDQARYESSAEEYHTDIALRWSHYIGDWSVAASAFSGTSREPLLLPLLEGEQTLLQPLYPQIKQFGVELLYLSGDWQWKAESIHRSFDSDVAEDYSALTAGFEYTYVGLLDQAWDLGMLAEYSADSREELDGAALQNDLLAGFRLALNDVGSTEILLGVIQDLDNSVARSTFMEASTRIGNATRVAVEFLHINAEPEGQALSALRRDSYIEVSVDYYF